MEYFIYAYLLIGLALWGVAFVMLLRYMFKGEGNVTVNGGDMGAIIRSIYMRFGDVFAPVVIFIIVLLITTPIIITWPVVFQYVRD